MMTNYLQLPEISIEICQACPMKCKHCSSSAGDEIPNVLSKEEIKNLIDLSYLYLRTWSFSLSGGDPLVKGGWDGTSDIRESEVFDIMNHGKKRCMQLLLYTSGNTRIENEKPVGLTQEQLQVLSENFGDRYEETTILNERTKKYESKVKFKIILSLHGTEKTHDAQMGVKGAFRELKRVMRDCKRNDIYVSIHCVPSGHNYHELLKIIDIAADSGAEQISFLRFVPQGRGLENIDMFKWGKMEFMEANKKLLLATLFRHDIKIRVGEPMDFMFLLNDNIHKKVCDGGLGKVLIRPDGDVHVCPAWKELPDWKAGNVRETKFTKIWKNAPTYQIFRDYYNNPKPDIKGKCSLCEYLSKCKGGCTAQRILSTGDIYGDEDPLCFKDLVEDEIGRNNINNKHVMKRIQSFYKYLDDSTFRETLFDIKFDTTLLDNALYEITNEGDRPSRYGLFM